MISKLEAGFLVAVVLTASVFVFVAFGKGECKCPQPILSCTQPACQQQVCPEQHCKLNCPSTSICSKPLFQDIAEEVAVEKTYELNSYNCHNFSKELIERLRVKGYVVSYCYGQTVNCLPSENNRKCKHAWVKVDSIYIEATSGLVLTPKAFKEEYEVAWCKKEIPVWK